MFTGSNSTFQEIAASFSGGGVRGYEYGPAFVPGEICRIFRAASEKFLHLVCLKSFPGYCCEVSLNFRVH